MRSTLPFCNLPLLTLLCLTSCGVCAPTNESPQGRVATLDVTIPSNRQDDQYYIVNLDFNGQTLPVLLDTGSGDIAIATTQCNATSPDSGCYNLEKRFVINDGVQIIEDEYFQTIVGVSYIYGNQSLMPVGFGSVKVPELTTPLVFEAGSGEFQNGSFSGILGLSMRNVSREYYRWQRLPPVDAMISEHLLEKPMFSLTLPRLGDPDATTGKLTLGGIEEKYKDVKITSGDIINTTNYNYPDYPLSAQGWTSQLTGIRVNGVAVNLSATLIDPYGRYVALSDSGAQTMMFREPDLDSIIALLDGPTFQQGPDVVYFECSRPQLLELEFNNEWYPIDPLDLITPGLTSVVNGTEYCKAQLGTWRRTFGDAILGVPWLRSVLSVYDYVTFNINARQPRLGYGSLVNKEAALGRYSSLYQQRLNYGS